jgi:hypothetical protein
MSFCATSLLKQKKRTVLDPIRANSFFFNNNVSNLYNNIVLLKKKYFYTLMFRKPNKTTINKIKRQIFIGQRPFDSRLYLAISRSFKVKRIVYI